MADTVEHRMSVNAISRVDPYVNTILAKSTHVALYRFNSVSNEWEKTDTEGALFLYSRNGEPLHSIMILNRLNTENLIEPIVKEFEYQMQAPFLLYRNQRGKIFGIWFYNREECVKLTLKLENVLDNMKENDGELVKKNDSVDIFRLLSRAQEDFNKTPNNNDATEPTFSTPRGPNVTSQSVMDFFAKASTKSASKPVNTPEGEIHFTLQRLMSNPAHSVEHIEKQQRSTTPQEQVVIRKKTNNNASSADRRSVPINIQNSLNVDGIHFIRGNSPQQIVSGSSPLASFIAQREATTSPLAQLLETPQKPALMPPMMFATSSKEKMEEDLPEVKATTSSLEPLTKNQMLQALTYLLKTDTEFVQKLHEAYVKSLSEMFNHNVH